MITLSNMRHQPGIELIHWGYYKISDNTVIASCYAYTLYEAQAYFEGVDLTSDPMYTIKPIVELK